MSTQEIHEQLLSILASSDFADASAELTEAWTSAGVGAESVDAVLRFMETHPELDYGVPGPLVHFVETFHRKGYEERLVRSIDRRPTSHTVWMLNRLINGEQEPQVRAEWIATLRRAATHPGADAATLERIRGFLNRIDS